MASFLNPPLQEALVPVTVALIVMLVSENKHTAIATRIQEFFFCCFLLYVQRFWGVTVIFSICIFISNNS